MLVKEKELKQERVSRDAKELFEIDGRPAFIEALPLAFQHIVAMPSRKMPDGEYKDIVHPITPELRKEITDTVIAKYNEAKPEEVVEE